MKKKIGRLLAAAALGVGLLAAQFADVAAAIDVGKACAVQVVPAASSDEAYRADLRSAGVVIDLYRVAEAIPSARYDSYTFGMGPAYQGLTVGEEMEAADWEALAQSAARVVSEGKDKPAVEGAGLDTEIRDGLKPGLYLLLARGSGLTRGEYLTEKGGKIVTCANSEEFAYTFLPELVALPTKEAAEDGYVGTDNPGPWIYELTGANSVSLKSERAPRFGALEIVKTLEGYEIEDGREEKPAMFVFSIEAEKDGRTVYSDVVSMIFTSGAPQRRRIEHIPVGARVTVKEIYSGASYQPVGDDTRTVVIAAGADAAQAAFSNSYGRNDRDGHGIENQFEYKAGGWDWDHAGGVVSD